MSGIDWSAIDPVVNAAPVSGGIDWSAIDQASNAPSQWDTNTVIPLNKELYGNKLPSRESYTPDSDVPFYVQNGMPFPQDQRQLAMGAWNGAAQIGATALAPYDWLKDRLTGSGGPTISSAITGQPAQTSNEQRRAQINDYFRTNADPNNPLFKTGTAGAETAMTAPIGGVLGKGVSLLSKTIPSLSPYLDPLVASLRTGGFSLDQPTATTAGQALINGATRVGGGALTGGAISGMVDPKDAGMGMLMGAALPATTSLLGEVGSGIRSGIIDPLFNHDRIIGNTVLKTVGSDNAANVANGLLNVSPQTQGVNFTASQKTLNPGLAGMEDALNSANPQGPIGALGQTNRNVLAGALRDIAQTPEAMAAAEEARTKATAPLYDAAALQNIPSDSTIEGILNTPAGKSAWARAQAIAANNKETISLGSNAPPSQTSTGILGPNGAPIVTQTPGTSRQLSVNGLNYFKKGLDDLITDPSSAIGKEQRNSVLGLKNDFLDWLGTKSPQYGQALDLYKTLSRPINQMQVGDYLTNKLVPPTAGDAPASLNASSLARSLQNPDQVAQRATGFSGATLNATMTPEQLAAINGVNSDASRIAQTQTLGAGMGSPTARRLAVGGYIGQNLNQNAPVVGMMGGLLGKVPLIGKLSGGVNNSIGERLQGLLANDPESLASIIMAAQKGRNTPVANLLANPVIRSGLLSLQPTH
jgi:hypothetical protein